MIRAASLFSLSDRLDLALPLAIPAWMTPGMAGVVVGAVSGVVLFGLVFLARAVLVRDRELGRASGGADQAGVHPAVRPRAWASGGGVQVVQAAPESSARAALPSAGALGAPSSATARPAPHPLSRIPRDSSAMRGFAPALAEGLVDDSPTEISETSFDEPLSVLRRCAAGVVP